MAKNIGLIKISGKIGDLQFFRKDGKAYVKTASSLDKNRIEKDPAFKRTRENMAEFGGSAKVSKRIREALIPIKSLTESSLHNRLTSLIRKTMNLGSGQRGKRAVEFSLNQDMIKGFELNKHSKVSEILYAPVDVTANADQNQLVLHIAEFLPSDYLLVPEGATHFRIHLAGLALSDFAPAGASNTYLPLNDVQHGLFAHELTAELPVDALVTGGISLTVDLPGAPVLTAEVSLVAMVGIEFLLEINSDFYLFATNNAIRIDKLF